MVVVVLALGGLVTCTPPPTTPPPSGEVSTTPPGAGAAASRIIVWTGCYDVINLSDAALDQWRSWGVGGFVCKLNYLNGLGGAQDFTADPNVAVSGNSYSLQRSIVDTQIVSRAAARGIKLWLGIGMSNYYNAQTPLSEWFDDNAWGTSVLPNIRNLAAGARALGFAGIAFDEELYGSAKSPQGTWDWNYPGNTHSEGDVRFAARIRGAQFMQAIVDGFPNVDIISIHPLFPEGWSELVQQVINGVPNAFKDHMQINFWDGMTSVTGYGAIRFMDHAYTKTSHLYRSTWDTAFTYDLNHMAAMFSRRLTNWAYASSRIFWSPFAWINSGTRPFELARPPEQVAQQLAAFHKWGTGGAFANYAFGGLSGFDYTPYVPAMQAAAAPEVVDTQPPSLTIGNATRSGGSVTWTGFGDGQPRDPSGPLDRRRRDGRAPRR